MEVKYQCDRCAAESIVKSIGGIGMVSFIGCHLPMLTLCNDCKWNLESVVTKWRKEAPQKQIAEVGFFRRLFNI